MISEPIGPIVWELLNGAVRKAVVTLELSDGQAVAMTFDEAIVVSLGADSITLNGRARIDGSRTTTTGPRGE